MGATSSARRPGRPRAEDAPVAVEAMLAAALRAFATYGYDGVSVNALSRQLDVSHNLLHQRFGSKDGLWYAAVDSAPFTLRALARELDPADPLEPATRDAYIDHVVGLIIAGLEIDPKS